jgi:hypothetical protein
MKAILLRTVLVEMDEEEAKNVLSLLTTDPDHDDKEERLVRTDLKNVLHCVLTQEEQISNSKEPNSLPEYYEGVNESLYPLRSDVDVVSQPEPELH